MFFNVKIDSEEKTRDNKKYLNIIWCVKLVLSTLFTNMRLHSVAYLFYDKNKGWTYWAIKKY